MGALQDQRLEAKGEPPRVSFYIQEKSSLGVARKFVAKLGGGTLSDSEEDAVFRPFSLHSRDRSSRSFLVTYCNCSPIPVRFNGKLANRPVILGSCDHMTFSHSGFPEGHALVGLGKPHPGPEGACGLLPIGGRLAPWVTLVCQGVNFRLPEKAFPALANLRGVVCCERLRKDLSQVQFM